MTRRLVAVAAWMFPVLTLALVIAMLVVMPGGSIAVSLVGSAAPISFAVTGAVIASRRPGNGIGWLLCVFAPTIPAEELLTNTTGGVAAGSLLNWGLWATTWVWAVMLVGLLVYLPLTFPHGRIRGRAAAAVAALGGMGVTAVVVGNALWPTEPGDGWVNPVGLHGHDALLDALTRYGAAPVGLAVIATIVMLVRRYRRSAGEDRQQLKWLVSGVSLAVLGAVGNAVLYETGNPELGHLAVGSGLLWLPVALGVGILRHRLYDIDRILSRTVAYAVLTALVVGVYLLAITALTAATSPVTAHSPLAIAAATLLAASVFGPLRRRIQGAVDRRFNRARYDAALAVASYRARLRDQLELEAITADLVSTAQSTLQPADAVVWVASPGGSS